MDISNLNWLTTIYEAEYNLFFNLKNPASTSISTYNTTKCICFVPPAAL